MSERLDRVHRLREKAGWDGLRHVRGSRWRVIEASVVHASNGISWGFVEVEKMAPGPHAGARLRFTHREFGRLFRDTDERA